MVVLVLIKRILYISHKKYLKQTLEITVDNALKYNVIHVAVASLLQPNNIHPNKLTFTLNGSHHCILFLNDSLNTSVHHLHV